MGVCEATKHTESLTLSGCFDPKQWNSTYIFNFKFTEDAERAPAERGDKNERKLIDTIWAATLIVFSTVSINGIF